MSDETETETPTPETVERVLHGILARAEGVLARASTVGVQRAAAPAPAPAGEPAGADLAWGARQILEPYYPPRWLAQLPQVSSILPQCLTALVTNIEGHGWSLREDGWTREGLTPAEVATREEERDRLRRWFRRAGGTQSWDAVREALRLDLETIGWAFWELVPAAGGGLAGINHVPARTTRLTVEDREQTLVTTWDRAPDGTWEQYQCWQRLRRYVQRRSGTGAYTWFKEAGDPRAISRTTGEVLAAVQDPDDLRDHLAREAIWQQRYNPAGPYGLPRWAGALAAVAGSRAMEEVNLDYFDHGAVPPLALLVDGGMLPEAVHEYLEQRIEELHGRRNFHRLLIIEAMRAGLGTAQDLHPGAAQTMKLHIEKLTDAQQGDALFQAWDAACRDKVRSACGVSPIWTGESQDYTRATAAAALEVGERGTFAPARRPHDEIVNRRILPRLEARWWRYQSNAPGMSSVADVVAALERLEQAGAATPNVAAQLVGTALGVEVPRVEEPWGDQPFALTLERLRAGVDLEEVAGVERWVRTELRGAVLEAVDRAVGVLARAS